MIKPNWEPSFVVPMPFRGIPVWVTDGLPYTKTDPKTGDSWDVHVVMIHEPILKTFGDLEQGMMVSKKA